MKLFGQDESLSLSISSTMDRDISKNKLVDKKKNESIQNSSIFIHDENFKRSKEDQNSNSGDKNSFVTQSRTISMLEMSEISEIIELSDITADTTEVEKSSYFIPPGHSKNAYRMICRTNDSADKEDLLLLEDDDGKLTDDESGGFFLDYSIGYMRRSQSMGCVQSSISNQSCSTRNSSYRNTGHEQHQNSITNSNIVQRRRSSLKASSSNLQEKNTGQTIKRNVSFSSLEIRSYNVTLGDQPCSCGPPISLDWTYHHHPSIVIDVNEYEMFRQPRRKRSEMFLPPPYRQYLLMREAGFTRGEIRSAISNAQRVQKQRKVTAKRLRLMPMEEILESTRKKLGKLAFMSKGSGL